MQRNVDWSLDHFIDALVVELDSARETLAVKSVNRPLSYAVKDVSLDLQIFPSYDGDEVRFRTAQPGQSGASQIKLQLASITDQQVRATSKPPPSKGAVSIEEAEVDPQTKRELRRLGVTTVDDLEQLESKNVDLEGATGGAVDYRRLANLIHKARRDRRPPAVRAASLETATDGPLLELRGENLCLSQQYEPVAVVDDALGEVVDYGPEHIVVRLRPEHAVARSRELILTLDPYCILRMQLDNPPPPNEAPSPSPFPHEESRA